MSSGPVVVFLGPSLSHEQAREILPDAVILPPAAMGDILGAVTQFRPHAIGLIDGTFLSNMSVFHKEILYAIDHGVWMLGGSSMGALRAAECDDYGMIGVGQIYQALASGELEDDDEVALTHAEASAGYRALSDAMVTIRATIIGAVDAGVVSQAEADGLLAAQKGRWFPERRLSSVYGDALALGMDEDRARSLRDHVRTEVIDPKRDDAIALLHRLASLPDHPVHQDDRPNTVHSGVFSAMLARDVVVETDDALTVTFDRMRRYAALHDPEYPAMMRTARHELVLTTVSLWLGGLPTTDELAAARTRVARRAGVELDGLPAWAASVDLTDGALDGIVVSEALIGRLESSWLGRSRLGEITATYLSQVRFAGGYPALKAGAALQHAAAKGVTLSPEPTPARLIHSIAALGAWEIPTDILAYIDDAELGSFGELLEAISTSVRAHHALFGIGLVDVEDDTVIAHEDAEPMMARGR